MQPLTYQQTSGFSPTAVINRSQTKQAVILNAPRHQKLKEISEGIVSMFRVDPDLAGPLMAMVTTMLGAI